MTGCLDESAPMLSAAFRRRRGTSVRKPHRGPGPACHLWTPPCDSDLAAIRSMSIAEARQYGAGNGLAKMSEESWRWILMIEWHQGQCAVCGTRAGRHVTDHDHETGLVRGFLCWACNVMEPNAGENSDLFAPYRERPPAVICGVACLYDSGWG